jgi:hypothetical protein
MKPADKSQSVKYRELLESGKLKIKKKDLKKLLKNRVTRESTWSDGDAVLIATNYFGATVTIKCKTLDECYQNLATLNGYRVQ